LRARGLDTVEFLIDLEKEFDIEIPDEDAELLGTVGEIGKYVCKHSTNEISYDLALRKIIAILVNNYGVKEGQANATSHVVYDLGLD